MGQHAQSIDQMLTLYPEAPERERPNLHLRLALAYARQGQETPAREWLAKVLTDRPPAHGQLRKAWVLSLLAAQQTETVPQDLLAQEAIAALRRGLEQGYRPVSNLPRMRELQYLSRLPAYRDLLWAAAEGQD